MQQINNQHRFALACKHPLVQFKLKIKQLVIANDFDAAALTPPRQGLSTKKVLWGKGTGISFVDSTTLLLARSGI